MDLTPVTQQPSPRFLTVPQVAEELATSQAQILSLVKRGDLPAIQIGGAASGASNGPGSRSTSLGATRRPTAGCVPDRLDPNRPTMSRLPQCPVQGAFRPGGRRRCTAVTYVDLRPENP